MSQRPPHADLVVELLNLEEPLPLTVREMAASLTVTFFPPHEHSERLARFASRLRDTLSAVGARVLDFADAIDESGKVRPGIVIIEQGEGRAGELAVERITGLYQNPLVALYDGPPPFGEDADLQATLDAIVGVLAWNLTHVPIFVEDDRWTICTMNGAVIACDDWRDMHDDVLQSLVPKLTAQVVPPRQADITYREGALDANAEGFLPFIDDFMAAAEVWRANGLMLAHTSIDALEYRSRFYRRIVAAYLDKRTGMSYGFMARQLPTAIKPAVRDEGDDQRLSVNGSAAASTGERGHARLCFLDRDWLVPVPEVWILGTRSGCEKTRINPERDIVRLGLVDGKIIFDTPCGVSAGECRPSYDTMAILAHGAGNAMAASVLRALDPDDVFAATLARQGLSLCHWHGYVSEDDLPESYVLHGPANPPVSCSTPQSAVYAFSGKLQALERRLRTSGRYEGDVHVEPHHGTNMSGCLSLAESARWVDRQFAREAA
jgi:hypothetical protein